MKTPSLMTVALIILLTMLVALPWLLADAFAPLRPSPLAETVTVYSITEAAFLTRDAQLEMSATSVIYTLPPLDDEPLPGDPDYTPPAISAQSASNRGLDDYNVRISLQSTATMVSAISSEPLERYSCPSPTTLMFGLFPPNIAFNVLGWNTDFDNVTYFLIEDEPNKPQVWLRVPDLTRIEFSENYLELPSFACRTYTARGTLQSTVVSPDESSPNPGTPTIPLPRIATATAPPPVPIQLTITDTDAEQQVLDSVPQLLSPQISITPDGIEIRGFVDLPGPLGTTIRGDLVIFGQLVQDGTDLRMELSSVSVAGRDITETEDGQIVENTINNWLSSLLIRRDVESFSLDDGMLVIHALERQTSAFPTSQPTQTATIIPEIIGTSSNTTPVSPTQQQYTATLRLVTATPRGGG